MKVTREQRLGHLPRGSKEVYRELLNAKRGELTCEGLRTVLELLLDMRQDLADTQAAVGRIEAGMAKDRGNFVA